MCAGSCACLACTQLRGEPEHLMNEARLIDESFECVMGKCDLEPIGAPYLADLIDLNWLLL